MEVKQSEISTPMTYPDMRVISSPATFQLIDKDGRAGILRTIRNSNRINYLVHYQTGDNGVSRTGHWACMSVIGKNIYFFDSLGLFPDNELNKINSTYRVTSGQTQRVLGRILFTLSQQGFNIYYNDTQYQNNLPSVATCGRYCAAFMRYMATFNEKDPYNGFKAYIGKFRLPNEKFYDQAIVRWQKERNKI